MGSSGAGKPLRDTIARRAACYLLGIFLVALGVIISVKSRLGVTPVQSIPYVISCLSGIDQGIVITGVYTFYVLVQAVILRRAFRPSGFLQIFIAVLFGFFVTLCAKLAAFTPPEAYYARLLLTCASVALIALGLLFYLTAELIPQPAEGLILAIAQLTGGPIHKIKVTMDSAMVAVASLLSFAVSGEVLGVREGTFIAMISVGNVLGVFMRLWGHKVRAFCFGGYGE